DRSAELGRQDAQGLALAVLLLAPGDPLLGLLALAQQQVDRLGEGPAQVRIADLLAAEAALLARRLVTRSYQPGIRDKLADRSEAADVVDLVQQHQGEDLAHARDRAQPIVGVGLIDLHPPFPLHLDIVHPFAPSAD